MCWSTVHQGVTRPAHNDEKNLKIRRFPLAKSDLLKMTEAERTFLLLAGHMQNEFTSLHKVFAWCLTNSPSPLGSPIESLANGSQGMIYARLLAGKLNEGWELMGKAYFGTKLSQKLENRLHPRAKECLGRIKVYFSKSNTICRVRNSFSFHYSAQEVAKNWEEAADEPGFVLLVGAVVGNTFYQASELVANLAVLNSIDPEDKPAAMQKFFEEVQEVASLFIDFSQGAIMAILEQQFGSDFSRYGTEEEIFPNRKFDEIAIPFFYQQLV